MTRIPIPPEKFLAKSHSIWDDQWFLLTSGDFQKGHYNTMTVSWGSLGNMWNRPFAQVVVRPTRYTFSFMEQYETFTLCAFPEEHREALNLLGAKSGRDVDKIAEAGLTPEAASVVAAPCFVEAELVLECKKIYWDDYDPSHFLDPRINDHYRQNYHRIYFGEILAITGVKHFSRR